MNCAICKTGQVGAENQHAGHSETFNEASWPVRFRGFEALRSLHSN